MMKNISIITNFGCDNNCWYCIWKKHSLNKFRIKTNWDKLSEFLTKYKDRGKVSISGGGDPLYHYEENKEWWNKLFSITDSLNMKVDVHTRILNVDKEFWKKINRVSLSVDDNYVDFVLIDNVRKYTNLRLVHVVTKYTTKEKVKNLIGICEKINAQLTLKELVGYNDEGQFEILKHDLFFPFFLKADDYNIYFMPDNKISSKFIF